MKRLSPSKRKNRVPTWRLENEHFGGIHSVCLNEVEASSAEYIVTGIKRHKVAAIIAVVVIIGRPALAYYFHARNTEVAIESIAVFPFENQNRDSSAEWVSDGVTESIINNLAQLPNLQGVLAVQFFITRGQKDPFAVGKESAFARCSAGGSRNGRRRNVSVELVDVRDNKQLWGDRFNHKVSDALMMQQEISQQILRAFTFEAVRDRAAEDDGET